MVGYRTFDADCCKPAPLKLQLVGVAFVGVLPLACCLLTPAPLVAALSWLAVLTLPRLLWRQSAAAEGQRFVGALALYWNLIYATCFTSPLLVVYGCYMSRRVFLPLFALYVLWARVLSRAELRSGTPWPAFAQREWGYHAFRRFLQLRIHVSEALQARPVQKPVILAVHPHGVASDYRILMDGMLYSALPGREVLVLSASVLFCIPLVRELALWTRCIDASRPVAARALKNGHSLMVIPGGEMEMIRTVKGRESVCLSTRLGFVKLALQANAALVPCYAFGCVDLYDTYSALHAPREWLRKKLGVCIPLYRGLIGVLPKRKPVDVVLGTPIEPVCAVPGSPSDDEIVAAHGAYVTALRRLFDEHKAEFGYGDRQLEVV